MVHRLRRAKRDEGGFTLIELLVVILIIGILAAIAIPALLTQKGKAAAAQAKELVRSAETTAGTIATDNNGEYTLVTLAELKKYEPSLTTNCAKEACLSEGTHAANSYSLVAVTPSGTKFTIKREANGEVVRTCAKVEPTAGCATGSW